MKFILCVFSVKNSIFQDANTSELSTHFSTSTFVFGPPAAGTRFPSKDVVFRVELG